jgi:hypothetical protein
MRSVSKELAHSVRSGMLAIGSCIGLEELHGRVGRSCPSGLGGALAPRPPRGGEANPYRGEKPGKGGKRPCWGRPAGCAGPAQAAVRA